MCGAHGAHSAFVSAFYWGKEKKSNLALNDKVVQCDKFYNFASGWWTSFLAKNIENIDLSGCGKFPHPREVAEKLLRLRTHPQLRMRNRASALVRIAVFNGNVDADAPCGCGCGMPLRMLNRASETSNRSRIRNRIRIPTHSARGPSRCNPGMFLFAFSDTQIEILPIWGAEVMSAIQGTLVLSTFCTRLG